MKRTIVIRKSHVYYRGKWLGLFSCNIDSMFGFRQNGKYIITITEGGSYKIDLGSCDRKRFFTVRGGSRTHRPASVCLKQFINVFFKPDSRKRYDITVKKVK